VEVGKRQLTSGEITRFYDLLCGAQAMGEDGYQRAVFGGLSEREQQALSIELADSAVELRIGVRGGFYACGLTYEPDIGWIDWATNHYRLSESLPV
jgi:hypothetical protein